MSEFSPPYNFTAGAVILVNKPLTWTSFDVVNKLRYTIKTHLGVKKIKVGHAGTLDPLATGLLIICTGKFTKRLESFQAQKKDYTGNFLLGKTTPSFDAEQEPDATYPTEHITPELLEKARLKFEGELEQYPPQFSAIKVAGVPLYKTARKGERIEVKPRPVHIFKFEIDSTNFPTIDFYADVSKGTYIRSLAHDFGKAVESGAYLTKLVRTSIGEYQLKDAWELEDLLAHIDNLESIHTKE
jgi:tRNA pseudouridine55 synthase